MRIQLMTAAAVFLLSVAGATAQTAKPQIPDDERAASTPAPAASFNPALAGTWKSAPEEMKLTSDFDKSVWGPNATSIRTVELTVRQNGEGLLRVVKKVNDAKGRVVPASTWIEEVQLKLGGSTPGVGSRVEHQTDVTSGVRLFPDDPQYRWPLEGLRVKVVTFADDKNSLEVRYDTPEGRGSFWETLKKATASAAPARKKK